MGKNSLSSPLTVLSSFLTFLFTIEDKVCILFVDHRSKKSFQRFFFVRDILKSETYSQFVELNKKYSIYFSVNRLRKDATSRKSSCFYHKQRVLYFDVDCDKNANALKKFNELRQKYNLPAPTFVVQTSSQNYQVYYVLNNEYDFTKLQKIMKFVNDNIGLDHTHDIARVLRLPTFFNRKPDKNFLVQVVEQNSAVPFSAFEALLREIEEIEDLADDLFCTNNSKVCVKNSVKVVNSSLKQSLKDVVSVKEFVKRLQKSEQDLKVKRAFDYYLSVYDKVQKSSVSDKSLSAVDFRFIVNYFSYVLSKIDVLSDGFCKEIDAYKACRDVIFKIARKRKYDAEYYTERTILRALEFVYSKNKNVKGIGRQRLQRLLPKVKAVQRKKLK